jgi:hypothetical protein
MGLLCSCGGSRIARVEPIAGLMRLKTQSDTTTDHIRTCEEGVELNEGTAKSDRLYLVAMERGHRRRADRTDRHTSH